MLLMAFHCCPTLLSDIVIRSMVSSTSCCDRIHVLAASDHPEEDSLPLMHHGNVLISQGVVLTLARSFGGKDGRLMFACSTSASCLP